MLEFLGVLFAAFMAIFIPRAILALVVGSLFGGWWWVLFAPLTIVAFIIDLLAIDAVETD